MPRCRLPMLRCCLPMPAVCPYLVTVCTGLVAVSPCLLPSAHASLSLARASLPFARASCSFPVSLPPPHLAYFSVMRHVTAGPIGLGDLVETVTNVALDKGEGAKDWRQRPLPPVMLECVSLEACVCQSCTVLFEKSLMVFTCNCFSTQLQTPNPTVSNLCLNVGLALF
jgi:hypothetical protein